MTKKQLEEKLDDYKEALAQALISLSRHSRSDVEWLESHDWWPHG